MGSTMTLNKLAGQSQFSYDSLMKAVGDERSGKIVLKDVGKVANLGVGVDDCVVSTADQNRATKAAVFKAVLARFGKDQDYGALLEKDVKSQAGEIEAALDKYSNPYVKEAFKFLLCGDNKNPLNADEMRMLDWMLQKGEPDTVANSEGVEEWEKFNAPDSDEVDKDVQKLKDVSKQMWDEKNEASTALSLYARDFIRACTENVQKLQTLKLPPDGKLRSYDADAILNLMLGGVLPKLEEGVTALRVHMSARKDDITFDIFLDDFRDAAVGHIVRTLTNSRPDLKAVLFDKKNRDVLLRACEFRGEKLESYRQSKLSTAFQSDQEFKLKTFDAIIRAAQEADPPKPEKIKPELPKPEQTKVIKEVKNVPPKIVQQPKIVLQKVEMPKKDGDVEIHKDLSPLVSKDLIPQSKATNCCWLLSAINAIKSASGGLEHLKTLIGKDGHTVKFSGWDGEEHVYDFTKEDFGIDMRASVTWHETETTIGEIFNDLKGIFGAVCTRLEFCAMCHALMYGSNKAYNFADINDMDTACKMLGLVAMPSGMTEDSTVKDAKRLIKERLDAKQIVTFNVGGGHFISIVESLPNDKVKIRDSRENPIERTVSMDELLSSWGDRDEGRASSLYFMLLPSELDAKIEILKKAKLTKDDLRESLTELKASYDDRLADYTRQKSEQTGDADIKRLKENIADVSRKVELAGRILEKLATLDGGAFDGLANRYRTFLATTKKGRENAAGLIAGGTADEAVVALVVQKDFAQAVFDDYYYGRGELKL